MIDDKNTLSELIIANSKDPDKAALRLFTGEVLKYGELILLKNQTQTALSQFNIQPHERVALITDNSLLYIPLTLAIIESAICVPLDIELSAEQYLENYQLLSVDYLLCDQTDGPAIEAATAYGIGIINFYVEESTHPTILRFNLVKPTLLPSDQDYKNDQTAFIFTTSGTTSKSKVVPMLYRDLVDAIELQSKHLDYTDKSVQLISVKIFRSVSLWAAFRILIANGHIIYTDGVLAKRIADTLLNFAVTHLNFQPAGMFSLYEYFEKHSIEYTPQHRLKIQLNGAPMPAHLKNDFEKRFNAELIDGYGMTEVGSITTTYKAPQGYRYGSAGHSISKEIKILDDEILVRGPGIFPGYENDPEANRACFIDGWFRTGDAGYLDADGYLYITGRIKELINRGGEKVTPYEVEQAILALGNIKEAVVFPYPNNRGLENVGAVIVGGDKAVIGLRELRSVLKDKIKPYKLPTLLYSVDKIPTSSANKVQRSFLYQQLEELGVIPESIKNSSTHEENDLTSTEFMVLDIWKNILEQEFISLDDNFFDIGGDSLRAAEVLASIEASFGCILPINQFFKKSTIREIADLVDVTPKFNPFKHIVPIRVGGNKNPLFLVHDAPGEVVTYHHIAKHIGAERPVYGLNFNFRRESWDTSTTLTEVAHTYVDEIQELKPSGLYYIGGLSVGGAIAFEMARILHERGCDSVVFMMDTSSGEPNRRATGRIHKLFKPAYIFKYAFNDVRRMSLPELPKLVAKKTRTLANMVFSKSSEKGKAQQEDPERVIIRSILKSMLGKYQPAFLLSDVYYFRALRREKTHSYRGWQQLCAKFVLIEKNCGHIGFVEPGFAADTAQEIDAILESYEINLQQ